MKATDEKLAKIENLCYCPYFSKMHEWETCTKLVDIFRQKFHSKIITRDLFDLKITNN